MSCWQRHVISASGTGCVSVLRQTVDSFRKDRFSGIPIARWRHSWPSRCLETSWDPLKVRSNALCVRSRCSELVIKLINCKCFVLLEGPFASQLNVAKPVVFQCYWQVGSFQLRRRIFIRLWHNDVITTSFTDIRVDWTNNFPFNNASSVYTPPPCQPPRSFAS